MRKTHFLELFTVRSVTAILAHQSKACASIIIHDFAFFFMQVSVQCSAIRPGMSVGSIVGPSDRQLVSRKRSIIRESEIGSLLFCF